MIAWANPLHIPRQALTTSSTWLLAVCREEGMGNLVTCTMSSAPTVPGVLNELPCACIRTGFVAPLPVSTWHHTWQDLVDLLPLHTSRNKSWEWGQRSTTPTTFWALFQGRVAQSEWIGDLILGGEPVADLVWDLPWNYQGGIKHSNMQNYTHSQHPLSVHVKKQLWNSCLAGDGIRWWCNHSLSNGVVSIARHHSAVFVSMSWCHCTQYYHCIVLALALGFRNSFIELLWETFQLTRSECNSGRVQHTFYDFWVHTSTS